MKKKSCIALGAIWFGAAVSVAEIEAGIHAQENWCALILGHILGGALLFATGLIGARRNRNAMETVQDAFGSVGGRFFATLNTLQLLGWTAVMISQGATAICELSGFAYIHSVVALVLLVAIWLFAVTHDRFHLTTLGMVLLVVLAVVLSVQLNALPRVPHKVSTLSFWAAFEISVAMPLSWLPLISDYTRDAMRPRAGTLTAVIVYTSVSIWMYTLGMILARSGLVNLATGIAHVGLGKIGLVIIVFSTMTTTFLDAYSAGESMRTIVENEKWKIKNQKGWSQMVGVSVCVLGIVLVLSGVVDRYVEFLYLIASIFAPMAAVLLVNYYFGAADSCRCISKKGALWNIFAWLIGTLTYHFAENSPIGPTLTALLSAGILAGMATAHRTKQIGHQGQ